jgi:hypothetical protein
LPFEDEFDLDFDLTFDFALTWPLPSVLRTCEGHVPPAATRMSPCRRCARSAFRETRILRYGFFFECVRWQIVTFFGVVVVVLTVVVVERVVVVGVVVVLVVVGAVVVEVDADVVVDADVLLDEVVLDEVELVVDDDVVLDVEVVCRTAAGLLPATTAAVKPPVASRAHTTSAVPNLRMRVNPPFPRSYNCPAAGAGRPFE